MDVNITTFGNTEDYLSISSGNELNCTNSDLSNHNFDSSHGSPTATVSNERNDILTIVFYGILCPSVSIFGIITNIINILVFLRQGFTETINLNFFGLAISDLLVETLTLTNCVAFILWVRRLNSRISFEFNVYSGEMHGLFVRATGGLTAFVTLERCLYVTIPLKVKDIITPFRTKLTIVLIFTVSAAFNLPFLYLQRLKTKYNRFENRTSFIIEVTDGSMEGLRTALIFINNTVPPLISFIIVVCCTIYLCVRIKQSAKHRRDLFAIPDERRKRKDKKMIKVVISITVVYIFTYTIDVIVITALLLNITSEFYHAAAGNNPLSFFRALDYLLVGFNSSWNIIIYYTMSTKYREVFQLMFRKKTD